MKVTILVVQRQWDGTIEVADAVDEYTMDENREYLVNKVQEVCDDLGPKKEYRSYGLVEIDLPDEDIVAALGVTLS